MRTKLPNTRGSVNVTLDHGLTTGNKLKFIVTFGYDADHQVREVFCADFKAGSDTHANIMDACILLSRLLQHGDSPADLAESMCQPPSLLGTIARAIASEAGR